MDDDVVLARVFRRILSDETDEWGHMGYVSLNDEHGYRPYLTLDLSTGQLTEDEYAVIKRVMEGK